MPVLIAQQKKEFKQFERNMKWFQDNYDKLRDLYADEFVAINNNKVIMHNKDARSLIRSLRDKYVDIGAFVIEFVSKEKLELIL